jgi:hypothetical protein
MTSNHAKRVRAFTVPVLPSAIHTRYRATKKPRLRACLICQTHPSQGEDLLGVQSQGQQPIHFA